MVTRLACLCDGRSITEYNYDAKPSVQALVGSAVLPEIVLMVWIAGTLFLAHVRKVRSS
jgi:hypothetical protein